MVCHAFSGGNGSRLCFIGSDIRSAANQMGGDVGKRCWCLFVQDGRAEIPSFLFLHAGVFACVVFCLFRDTQPYAGTTKFRYFENVFLCFQAQKERMYIENRGISCRAVVPMTERLVVQILLHPSLSCRWARHFFQENSQFWPQDFKDCDLNWF